MKIDIDILNDSLTETPTESGFLHVTIICGALKHCLGSSKTMSFIKLAYIFDKTISLEQGAFSSKITLSAWSISKTFKQSLIMAEAHDFIELNVKNANEIRINVTSSGDEFLSKVERLDAFRDYLDYLKDIRLAENRFENITIRSELNAH